MSRPAVAAAEFDRDAAARELLPRAIRVARRYAFSVGRGIEVDEYESAAHLGLAEAFATYSNAGGEGSLWRWVYRLVVQRCFQLRRRDIRRFHQADKVEYEGWNLLGGEDETRAEWERDADVAALMESIGRRDRELIRLMYWEGLSGTEVGRKLGFSDVTAYSHKKRILSRFRDRLS